MRIVLVVVCALGLGSHARADLTSEKSSPFVVLPEDREFHLCAEEIDAPLEAQTWMETVKDDPIEQTLQRIRYSLENESLADQNLLYQYVQPAMAGYLYKLGIKDSHLAEEIFHDAYIETINRIREARHRNEPPLQFARFLFGSAKYRARQSWRRCREYLCFNAGDVKNDSALPFDRTKQNLFGAPIPLTDLQLTVLRGLSQGKTHRQISEDMQCEVRLVHYYIGGVEAKLQIAMDDKTVRRSELRFLPVVGQEHQVFIEWSRGSRNQTFVGEGNLPFEKSELRYLTLRIQGQTVTEVTETLGLSDERARYLETRLMTQRRHDYEDLFGQREGIFERTIEINIPQAEGEFALFRAFGLERADIAEATKFDARTISTRYDRLRQRIVDGMAGIDRDLDFRKMYYALPDDSLTKIRLVIQSSQGKFFLIRGRIGEPNENRRKHDTEYWVDRDELLKAIQMLDVREREMVSLRILQSVPTPEIASRLGIRVDTVRTHLAHATLQLANILHLPRLNTLNLRIKTDRP